MKKIKTIMVNADHPGEFDDRVNAALRDGWKLVRRDVLHPHDGPHWVFHRMFYAELERETVPPEVLRDCQTCKWVNRDSHSEPCRNCLEGEKWEEQE